MKESAMSVANPKSSLNVRDQVSKEEWDARVNLAAAYRLVALYGVVPLWVELLRQAALILHPVVRITAGLF
jgi:hypothetical protein